MNNPDNLPVDVEEQRSWIIEHKKATGHSWSLLAQQSGIAQGTLSVFAGGNYQGDKERVARDLFRYRQHLTAQAELDMEAPEIPEFVDTPTAHRLTGLLKWGQRGRIVVAAMGPGTGKTKAAHHYRDSVSNVWLATMAPSTAGVNNMQIEVLSALGERDARGTPQALSKRIRDRVRDTKGLIVIDEAQHLSEKAVEEIRSWHDATGIGIALFGNEMVIARLEGGSRKAAYAQLYSRVAMRHVQMLPEREDARVLAYAWGIEDAKLVEYVVAKSQMPGGLRGITMMLEIGTMIAASERKPLELSHLADAWVQLVSRPIAA